MSKYRFNMRRTKYDKTGYYYTRWDNATSMSVIAETQGEAINKALALSPVWDKYSDWRWTFHIDSIEEVDISEES